MLQLLADLENSPMFTNDLECQKLLMEAMKYHLLPERRSMMQSPRTKPRKSTVGSLYAVGGMDATKGRTMICQSCLHLMKAYATRDQLDLIYVSYTRLVFHLMS